MPLISNSTYLGPPKYLFNGHLETIIPSIFRKIEGVSYRRERIYTPDEDFLDLDWSRVGSTKLLIISHGLEGSSNRHYAKALVKLFNGQGVDALAWNNRTCSGEMNKQAIMYHHGATYDLDTVIEHVAAASTYEEIWLVGISMGGAQTLKYLGEKGLDLNSKIKKAAVYSTPCNLADSAATLSFKGNAFYRKRFLKKLKLKMQLKGQQFPGLVDLDLLERVEDFTDFDTHFTAKIHGFKDASDFYNSVSADNWMQDIQIPTLIINAQNDPLLYDRCYPINLARESPNIYLEIPKRGGHTGFLVSGQEYTWAETRFLSFLLDEKYYKFDSYLK
ncbi:YheT family hydrolase [Belliella kenyensis]|uniref:YheT family hydrolase n=1 Tax=Belliella kenyensis TaxID=1472724 RepID=A0ABV8ELZ5_9BACT|nr:alpha/beta fold hydrolase [Belliella kenyensis]MCH7400326.1 alpha/beta fold hydrolase [Belliella kenyensis]MDN3604656.1 alpha/beta fold hydrolase [Belliella kenyensis]